MFVYIIIYRVAFGPSRRRAWNEGQMPLRCLFGPPGGSLVSFLEPDSEPHGASWGRLGGLLTASLGGGLLGSLVVASWSFFWVSWALLGASYGHLGGMLGILGAILKERLIDAPCNHRRFEAPWK